MDNCGCQQSHLVETNAVNTQQVVNHFILSWYQSRYSFLVPFYSQGKYLDKRQASPLI